MLSTARIALPGLLLACTPEAGPHTGHDGAEEVARVDDRTVALDPPMAGYQLVTPAYEVPPFTEVDLCSIVRLDALGDETFAWVNRFESLVSEGTHHMNVLIGQFTFLDAVLGDGASAEALGAPVGQVPCSELSTMESSFPVFPSQRQNQEIVFPPGVAVPITAPAVLVFSHHFINPTDTPIRINAALNVQTLPSDEVEQVAGLVFDAIGGLAIEPGTRQVAHRTCTFDREADVVLVSTHNHGHTECATLHHVDGSTGTIESDPFFVNHLWDQPPILHFEPGTFSVEPGDGVHYACHYANDTTSTVVDDGTAEGEMCVFAAVTWPLSWTVSAVEEVMRARTLDGLLGLMGDALGPCDGTRDDLPSPWSAAARPLDGTPSTCDGLEQTESNVLDW